MKKSRKATSLLETLLVIGLILIIPLFFVIQTRANPQIAENTPAPIEPTVAENSALSSAVSPQQPQQCTFPLEQTTAEESAQEEYIFSEPQEVQANLSNIYEIIQWLPDNQRVLITQTYQDKSYQSIELLNPETDETQVYATRTTILGKPVWIQGLNAVAYPLTNLVNVNSNNPNAFHPPYHLIRQLWISYGDPANAQLLESAEMTLDYSSVFSVATNPSGNRIIYLANTEQQLFQRNASDSIAPLPGTLQPMPFNSAEWDYRRDNPNTPASYNITWRPNSTQILLYSNKDNGSYTFILDTENGDICEISLVGTTKAAQMASELFPHWSPNGRYLATVSAGGFVILDTTTGYLYEADQKKLISTEIKGQLSINDITWAPDSTHLVAAVQISDYSVPLGEDYIKLRSLYVIDILSNQVTQILSNIRLGANFGNPSILWSNDGTRLLTRCATENGLCLLTVQKNTRP